MEKFNKIDAYYIDIPVAKSGWKKAQHAVYDYVRANYINTIIRKDDVKHLVARLQKLSDAQKNPVPVSCPNLDDKFNDGTCWIHIGEGCYIVLHRATKLYDRDE